MTLEQFEEFVERPHIEWAEEEDSFLFRDTRLRFYADHADRATKVLKTKMAELSVEDLESAITRGLKVEQITRVTGYFARVNAFNPGKLGELQDRHRSGIGQ